MLTWQLVYSAFGPEIYALGSEVVIFLYFLFTVWIQLVFYGVYGGEKVQLQEHIELRQLIRLVHAIEVRWLGEDGALDIRVKSALHRCRVAIEIAVEFVERILPPQLK